MRARRKLRHRSRFVDGGRGSGMLLQQQQRHLHTGVGWTTFNVESGSFSSIAARRAQLEAASAAAAAAPAAVESRKKDSFEEENERRVFVFFSASTRRQNNGRDEEKNCSSRAQSLIPFGAILSKPKSETKIRTQIICSHQTSSTSSNINTHTRRKSRGY